MIFNSLQHKTLHFSDQPKWLNFDEWKCEKLNVYHKRQNDISWLAKWIIAVLADVTVSMGSIFFNMCSKKIYDIGKWLTAIYKQSLHFGLMFPWNLYFYFLTLPKVNDGKSCYEKVALDIYRHVNKRNKKISTIAMLKSKIGTWKWENAAMKIITGFCLLDILINHKDCITHSSVILA